MTEISFQYEQNRMRIQHDLEKKVDNQAKNISLLSAHIKKLKEDNTNLRDTLRVKNINLSKAADQFNFLKERIERFYGKAVFLDMMNHVDNPVPFDGERYKVTFKVKSFEEVYID